MGPVPREESYHLEEESPKFEGCAHIATNQEPGILDMELQRLCCLLAGCVIQSYAAAQPNPAGALGRQGSPAAVVRQATCVTTFFHPCHTHTLKRERSNQRSRSRHHEGVIPMPAVVTSRARCGGRQTTRICPPIQSVRPKRPRHAITTIINLNLICPTAWCDETGHRHQVVGTEQASAPAQPVPALRVPKIKNITPVGR